MFPRSATRAPILASAVAHCSASRAALLAQAAAARLFAGCTILTIAHRLDVVAACDTVVVLDAGRVAEAGPAYQLLRDSGSRFSALVDMSGPEEAAALRAAAQRHYEASVRQAEAQRSAVLALGRGM